jgi:dTDP-glucose pyrophosphorylase
VREVLETRAQLLAEDAPEFLKARGLWAVLLVSQSRASEAEPHARAVVEARTRTLGALHDASSYVRVIEERQGIKVSCPEEIAWRHGWIDDEQLLRQAEMLDKSGYGVYLRGLLR